MLEVIHGVPVEYIRDNYRKLYNAATPAQISEGMAWYAIAHASVKDTVYEASIEHCDYASMVDRGCEALAILSPRCPWEVNLEAFRALAYAMEPDNARGILLRNWAKACRHYWVEYQPIKTEKVRTFAVGLKTSGKTREVCLDTHMLRAALGREPSSLELGRHFRNTAGCYEALARIVRILADEWGITPPQYQAVVWLVQRG